MLLTNLMEKQEKVKTVVGTTCKNCIFSQTQKPVKVTKGELNKFGGISPKGEEDLTNQKIGDVITMPGKVFPTEKLWCSNQKINQYVTERMCCNFWNAPGILYQTDLKEYLEDILESLTNPLPFKKIRQTPTDIRYGFIFERTTFFVDFILGKRSIDNVDSIQATATFYEVDDNGNPDYSQTHKFGNSLRLFSTVKSIVDQVMPSVDFLVFTAMEEGSRVGLYSRMVKKHAVNGLYPNITETPLGTLYIIGKRKLTNETKKVIVDTAEEIIRQKQG